jgi:serine/threonine protein kinase
MPADAAGEMCAKCTLVHAVATVARTPSEPSDIGRFRGQFVAPSPQELGSYFPHLEIQELLGEGGMGAVYKARQPGLDRLVALKILPAEAGRDPAFTERFTREARALAKLNHPNIITIYDFGHSGNLYYFLMEYVDGANLRQLLRHGFLKPAEALRIVPQICEALQYAHEEGLVHRDIKPENILVDKKGRVKVADFGIAKLLGRKTGDQTLTGPWQVMGTLHYMAPEQMADPLHVDHRADLYSLGVVFYEILTGQLPLGRFAPPSQKAAVDARLDHVVLRALEGEPARRYQNASEIRNEIEAIGRTAAWLPSSMSKLEADSVDFDPQVVRRKVFWPSLGLLLSGVFSLLPSVYIPVIWVIRNGQPEPWEDVLIVLIIISSLIAGVITWGGVRMSRLEWLPVVTVASVLAMVPFTAGWILGFPAGLWAFIVLRDPEVIAAFRRRSMKTGPSWISSSFQTLKPSKLMPRSSAATAQAPISNNQDFPVVTAVPATAPSSPRATPIPRVTPAAHPSSGISPVVARTPRTGSRPASLQRILLQGQLRWPKIALVGIGILNLVQSLNSDFKSYFFGLPSIPGLSLAAAIMLLVAARRMRQLRSYKFVRWTCCLTFVPFISPTWPLSLVVGIWCTFVLTKPEIKAAFESSDSGSRLGF